MLHAAVTSLEHASLSKVLSTKASFCLKHGRGVFHVVLPCIAAAVNQIDVDSRKIRKHEAPSPFSGTADVDEAG